MRRPLSPAGISRPTPTVQHHPSPAAATAVSKRFRCFPLVPGLCDVRDSPPRVPDIGRAVDHAAIKCPAREDPDSTGMSFGFPNRCEFLNRLERSSRRGVPLLGGPWGRRVNFSLRVNVGACVGFADLSHPIQTSTPTPLWRSKHPRAAAACPIRVRIWAGHWHRQHACPCWEFLSPDWGRHELERLGARCEWWSNTENSSLLLCNRNYDHTGPSESRGQMDYLNSCIRSLNVSTRVLSTLAGQCGTQGVSDGAGTRATFFFPYSASFDSSGSFAFIVRTVLRD